MPGIRSIGQSLATTLRLDDQFGPCMLVGQVPLLYTSSGAVEVLTQGTVPCLES